MIFNHRNSHRKIPLQFLTETIIKRFDYLVFCNHNWHSITVLFVLGEYQQYSLRNIYRETFHFNIFNLWHNYTPGYCWKIYLRVTTLISSLWNGFDSIEHVYLFAGKNCFPLNELNQNNYVLMGKWTQDYVHTIPTNKSKVLSIFRYFCDIEISYNYSK